VRGCVEAAMNVLHAVGAVITILLFVYLVFAMLRPERF
jgi:K+-transporting ATPase KdpF subunit